MTKVWRPAGIFVTLTPFLFSVMVAVGPTVP